MKFRICKVSLYTFITVMVITVISCSSVLAIGSQQWRFGVGVATQNMVDGQTTTNLNLFEGYRQGDRPWNPLGIGWYFNWNWKQRYGPVCDPSTGWCIPFAPLVGGWRPGVNPSIATIRNYVNANPTHYPDGTIWLIGNEVIWDDSRTPLQYARDYHDFYYGLKSINPTYRVAFGAIITSVHYNQPGFSGTPIELCNAILAAYQSEYGEKMPVDLWRIHPYVWTMPTIENQLAYFEQMLKDFRAWMASVGEQNKPLIITEYGLSNYHTEQHMIDYMLRSFEILLKTNQPNGMPGDEGRLIQQWAWFVNNNHVWQAGGAVQWTHCALYNGDTFDMRPLGRMYSNHPKEPNAIPAITATEINSNLLIADDTSPYTVTITVRDDNGADHITDIRAMFHNGGSFTSENARAYFVWAKTDTDITSIGGSWTLMGDVQGGGRWAYCTNDWGGNTYVTPISASTSINGGSRSVTFTFTVKSAWSPAGDQRLRSYCRDAINTGSGWAEQSLSYDIVSSLGLGNVHNAPDGTTVNIPCAIVTAGSNQLASTAYIQALDRSAGIKIYGTNLSVSAGDLVNITGKLQTQFGERVITQPVVTRLASNRATPPPLFTIGRWFGGESPNPFTQPVYGSVGIYNVGLLVAGSGIVTHSDPIARYFYIEDGSSRYDESGYSGIKVSCSGLASGNVINVPAVGSHVIVVGILSTQALSGRIIPVLRPRSQNDIRLVLQ